MPPGAGEILKERMIKARTAAVKGLIAIAKMAIIMIISNLNFSRKFLGGLSKYGRRKI